MLFLVNLLVKQKWTRHLLIHYKYRVNQVRWSTYLAYIMAMFWISTIRRTSLVWLVQTKPVASHDNLSLLPMKFLLLFTISGMLPCLVSSRNLWVPLKKDNALSTDVRVKSCTRFMRSPSLVPFMYNTSIFIGYKYPFVYVLPKEVNGSSVPNIGHITQHYLMQMVLPYMSPGVSLTIIVIPLFIWGSGWFFLTVPFDKQFFFTL